jgi:3-hydroxyisobutyrate dehydrogenase
MKIAFIGLGAIGYPMAKHLAREHELLVWNRTKEVAARHAAEHGSTAVHFTACADAEAIVTCLPTSREVDEVVDGLWSLLRPGTLWIDATSGDPMTSRKTADRLREKGVTFVDAPVTGGTPGAEKGALTVMIGGTEDDFRRAEPVVKPYAGKIVHVGATGAGHAIKAINNALLAINMLGAAEGFLLARRFGIDLGTAFEVLNAGSGRSNATENLLPGRLLEGRWPPTFRLALHEKDMRIAASMAQAQHLSAPVLGLTTNLFTAALNDSPEADYVEAVKYVAKMNGETW